MLAVSKLHSGPGGIGSQSFLQIQTSLACQHQLVTEKRTGTNKGKSSDVLLSDSKMGCFSWLADIGKKVWKVVRVHE